MPKRSSKDENERAFDAILAATDDATGPEILAELIGSLREGIEEGASDEDLALRLWPRLARIVATVVAENMENPAAVMGRKGGKRGGKARAEKLSADERSEIARVAAQARWKKAKDSHD